MYGLIEAITKKKKELSEFPYKPLPIGSVPICKNNPKHAKYVDYLERRKIEWERHEFYCTPHASVARNKNRIIVPYAYHNVLVGHVSRYLDNNMPKYIQDHPTGYVYGYDMQDPTWSTCILSEGVFDALSIDGCALLGNIISEDQSIILSTLNRRIIFVPHQDKAGLVDCEHALEFGYAVSIPIWGEGIKDINEAVSRYGKFPTLYSILNAATNSSIKIALQKKKILNRIKNEDSKGL